MRLIIGFVILLLLVLCLFGLKYGFDYSVAGLTLLLAISINPILYYMAKYNREVLFIPKIGFYALAGAMLTLCFHPLLDFYSLKSTSYSMLDWAATNDAKITILQEKAWYGLWYIKILFALMASLVAVTIQRFYRYEI
jgi:hypothetical protein